VHNVANNGATSRAAGADAKSIAVLPFENFGDNSPPSYFADGVQDNILTDLGKVEDLKVISRNGVAPYRGKALNAKQIGRELGVANVLQGSLQISGDRVRINAQLIDTRTETQIWANHYDRKVEDIFALQSELAQTIVGQLKATLSSHERDAIWKRPTEDMQAYDLYLRGRSALHGSMGTEPSARWSEAVDLLQAASARDSKFTLAYCLLADAHLSIYRWGDDHSPARLAAAKEAAETALRLEPELEEARLALASYFYDGLSDYRRTQSELSLIPETGAHPEHYYTLASLVQRRLGLWSESIRNGEKAVELDPQAPQLAFNLVQTLSGLKRYDEAERVANAAIFRMPPRTSDRLWLLKHELEYARGDLAAARKALEATSNKDAMEFPMARLWLCLTERDLTAARAMMAEATPEQKKSASFWLTFGTFERAAGNAEEARSAFEETKRAALEFLEKRPEAPEVLGDLAAAYAALGNKEEALRAAQRSSDVTPKGDALAGPMRSTMLAQIVAWNGDHERALALLADLIKVPFGPSYGDLKFNPGWDDLRDDPRFDRLIEDAGKLMSSQNKPDSGRQ
jgi:TolB-like protein